MAELVVVERNFTTPVALGELQCKEGRVGWCLEQHDVKPLHSYVSSDGATVICLYHAPDVEAVRTTQRTGGLPFERAWAATLIGEHPTAACRVLVAERWLPEPITLAFIEETLAQHGHCLQIHSVEFLASHLARDGKRMICTFRAPDAEAVRTVSRQFGFPVDRLWAGDAVV